jgi:hypothetical protein
MECEEHHISIATAKSMIAESEDMSHWFALTSLYSEEHGCPLPYGFFEFQE